MSIFSGDNKLKKLLSAFNTRVGLLSFIVFFVWVKSMIAYFGVFNLRGVGPAELLLMIIKLSRSEERFSRNADSLFYSLLEELRFSI